MDWPDLFALCGIRNLLPSMGRYVASNAKFVLLRYRRRLFAVHVARHDVIMRLLECFCTIWRAAAVTALLTVSVVAACRLLHPGDRWSCRRRRPSPRRVVEVEFRWACLCNSRRQQLREEDTRHVYLSVGVSISGFCLSVCPFAERI